MHGFAYIVYKETQGSGLCISYVHGTVSIVLFGTFKIISWFHTWSIYFLIGTI